MKNFSFWLQVTLFAVQAVVMIWITVKSSHLEKIEKDEFLKKAH
jgi:hypothetical protein